MKEYIDILSVVTIFGFLFIFIVVKIYRYQQSLWKRELIRYQKKIKKLEDELWLCASTK